MPVKKSRRPARGLTCRIAGLEGHSPVRIVADSRLRLPLTAALVKSAKEVPLWLLTIPGNDRDRLKALADLGVTVIEVAPEASGLPDMRLAKRRGKVFHRKMTGSRLLRANH